MIASAVPVPRWDFVANGASSHVPLAGAPVRTAADPAPVAAEPAPAPAPGADTDEVLREHGRLWFNDESYVVSRKRE